MFIEKENVMETVSLERYSPELGDHLLTAQLVECYREVFADKPWHEWLKCPHCQKYWGTKDRESLADNHFRHCGKPLVDFWPRDQVEQDLRHEITTEASCWLARYDQAVIGFCWGYPITIAQLEAKLGVTLNPSIKLPPTELVAYQDEVGVLSAYRGRKIAKAMVTRRLDDFLARGLQFGIVRTRQGPEPSATFSWYTQKLGYELMGEYPANDGRVVLGRRLSGLRELLTS